MEVYYKLYLSIVLSSHNFVPCMLSFGDFKLWECCSRNDGSATAAIFKNINYKTDPLKLFTVMQTTDVARIYKRVLPKSGIYSV